MSARFRPLLVVIVAMLVAPGGVRGQSGSFLVAVASEQPAPPAARHALLICGLAGDGPHRVLFAETIEQLYRGLTTHHGFAPDRITVLWGESKGEKDGPAISASREPATRDAIGAAAKALTLAVQPADTLWVFVLGHAHYDGRNSWLNLPGPDLSNTEFGELFASVRCQEQVFFMTTAASGFFVRPLSLPGRIVIAATEADREVNETLFPHKLAAALADPPPFLELDLDDDGRLSLFDAYLWVTRETAQEYATNMLLATEHAQLDDNGDGRGTELQVDFLTEELGGRRRGRQQPVAVPQRDGARARGLFLAHPPSPPAPAGAAEQ
jgi:hypothetical protein